MVVLGIDPGGANTGYGVIESKDGRLRHIDSGCIRPSRKLAFAEKLLVIYRGVSDLLDSREFDALAIEDVYQGINARTAARIGHVRGIVLLAAAERDIPVSEYPPNEIKSAVVGNGHASKEQVKFMTEQILRPDRQFESYDEADGVAAAICWCHRHQEQALR